TAVNTYAIAWLTPAFTTVNATSASWSNTRGTSATFAQTRATPKVRRLERRNSGGRATMASLRDRSAVRLVIRIKPTEAIEKRTGALAGPGPGSLVVGFADYSKSTSRSGGPGTFCGVPGAWFVPF